MKNIITIIICIVSCSIFSQEKKVIKVTYGKLFEYSKDSTNVKNREAFVSAQNLLENIKKSTEKVEYNLFIGENVAKFEYEDILQDESFQRLAITLGGGEPHYYDLKYNRVFRLNIEKKKLVEYQNDSIKWDLTNESKKINGFVCYRAFGKTKIYSKNKKKEVEYDVWYCPQFNNSCGPSQFFGVPGLIFEASYRNKMGLKFYLKKIEYVDKMNLQIPDLQILSEEENYTEISSRIKKIKGD